jgi:flotillin
MEIAEKQTSLAIRQAELKQQSDVKKAEADAAYSIQEQEQRKTIEVTSANADIARADRVAELRAKEVEVTKQTLDAEIRAKADAERYAAEQEAEAELYRRTKEAEAKMIECQREAEGIRAVGEAEAEAIRLKALAEAEGIDKKAEAMRKYGEAAVVEMIMAALPSIAKNVAEPLSKVDKITMYGEGNSAKLISDIVNGTTQITEGISSGMGIDIKSLIMGALGG